MYVPIVRCRPEGHYTSPNFLQFSTLLYSALCALSWFWKYILFFHCEGGIIDNFAVAGDGEAGQENTAKKKIWKQANANHWLHKIFIVNLSEKQKNAEKKKKWYPQKIPPARTWIRDMLSALFQYSRIIVTNGVVQCLSLRSSFFSVPLPACL